MVTRSIVMARPHKYGAVKTAVDGIVFQSAKEARRYRELRLLEKAGEITELELQPVFELFVVPLLKPTAKVIIGRYMADFRYRERGELVIEDVKSTATKSLRAYRLRKRMVEAIYGICVTEV